MPRLSRRGVLGSAVLLSGAGLTSWRMLRRRPQPAEAHEALFEGIVYERENRQAPRPMVLHWLSVDLSAPGVRFLVTPGKVDSERPLVGKKTTAFLAEHDCQIAINADFFYPWYSSTIWDYYPKPGDPVAVEGVAVSEGVPYNDSDGHLLKTTLWISKDNTVQIGSERPPSVWNACGGHRLPLEGSAEDDELSPRVAVGLAGKTLLILVIDGRQKGYSEGATVKDLAELLQARGATVAINLDGGGSATIVAQGRGILNSPIDCKIPGRERHVANHLGIFAKKLT
ncbi:phosphodiester glycosidase family protein [Armatimonas sp.]|uniref:phosphodiester glycosidase family protein n=1 Tax=Armatimonas sp. TaxID=1872638 RepID=UPI0037533320